MHHHFLAVGLPKTGKTTFVIALWHTLDSQSVEGSLILERVEGNIEYLETLRSRWLQGLELGRTTRGKQQVVRMSIRDRNGAVSAQLTIPDLAGETFQDHWLDRQWGTTFSEAATSTDGLLVFLHPLYTSEPTPIASVFVPEVASILVDGSDTAAELGATPDEDNAPEGVRSWDPVQAPTAVQLVEVLQFLERAALDGTPVPTAVVVSAWDIIDRQSRGTTSPEAWARNRVPLLYQFLQANHTVFRTRYYGVSAQGGDISTDRERLLALGEPTDRVIVVDSTGRSNDLTRPIKWLMNLDGPEPDEAPGP